MLINHFQRGEINTRQALRIRNHGCYLLLFSSHLEASAVSVAYGFIC